MLGPKVRPIFRGLVIVVAGDLGGGQWTDTNIARWVGQRAGKFLRGDAHGQGCGSGDGAGKRGPEAKDLKKKGKGLDGNGKQRGVKRKREDLEAEAEREGRVLEKKLWEMGLGMEDVTHVVCSKEEFRSEKGVAKALLKRQRKCQFVTLDWLEDSMHRCKRLKENDRKFSHLLEWKLERERERRQMNVIKGLQQGIKAVNPNLYRLYRDHTFFRYDVVLTRDEGERYILMLYESNNAQPRLYWFVAKYYRKKSDTQALIYRPSGSPGTFAREFAKFEYFFEKKTEVPWAKRLIAAPASKRAEMGGEAGTDGWKEGKFRYTRPGGGKPVGWVPAEFVPAEEEVVEKVEEEKEEEFKAEDEAHEEIMRDESFVDGTGVIMMEAE